MKMKFFGLFFILCAIVFAVYSANQADDFALAEDFPHEALFYVQSENLPELVKILNSPKFAEKIFESSYFSKFQNGRLGKKLANRRAEFDAAGGFPLDLETLATLADKRAAFAIYDIGKLDFVFIAPISAEIFVLTKFSQNKSNFEEQILEDGTAIYRVKVEADRGRQKQELIFCHLKNRLVVATTEKLLAQTLGNINDTKNKNPLAENSDFSLLTTDNKADLISVWVNQTALNEDYYFKRYWLMQDSEKLKNIRAGLFNFSLEDKKVLEKRKFLLEKPSDSKPIAEANYSEITAFVPENTAFYRIEKADVQNLDKAIRKTLFPKTAVSTVSENENYFSSDFFASLRHANNRDYSWLDSDFDENIDDEKESFSVETEKTETDFSVFFQAAKPQAILTLTAPKVLPAPRFVEFNHTAIFNFSSAKAVDFQSFETAVARNFASRLMIENAKSNPLWQTKVSDDIEWRELNFPMIGLAAVYAIRGNNLILCDKSETLWEIIRHRKTRENTDFQALNKLTVIDLKQKENAFDKIFAEFEKRKIAEEFFLNSISDLVKSFSDFSKIEIKENYSEKVLEQTITFSK